MCRWVPPASRPGRRSRIGLGSALLAFGLVLSACTTGGPQPVTPIRVDAGRAAQLISAYRAENGLGPVGVDSRLMKAAADYARVMGERDRIGHRIGASLPRRVAAVGYDWGFVAENLAAGYSTVEDAMQGWKNSPGHRQNLLNPYAAEIGIAAVATPPGSDRRNYWALILAMQQPKRLVARTVVGSIR